MNNKVYKPGDTFEMDHIPEGFRDLIKPINGEAKQDQLLEVAKPEYTVKSRAPGWYDVLAPNGKKVNEKALKLDEAKALVESL